MKGTEQFKEIIRLYLREKCKADKTFLGKCKNPQKSLDKCIEYIIAEVYKSKCNGFTDDEIFSLAVHYFDEENITYDKVDCSSIVVNHHVELTDEEKAHAKAQAIERYQAQIIADLQKPKTNKRKNFEDCQSLF